LDKDDTVLVASPARIAIIAYQNGNVEHSFPFIENSLFEVKEINKYWFQTQIQM